MRTSFQRESQIRELKTDPKPEDESRIENLGEFVNVAKEYVSKNSNGTLDDFLNNISLLSDTDQINENEDMVSLMTIHSAKGLEFPVIFVTGLEEGLFPISKSMLDPNQIEEERRACYVAITRAQKKLYLTYAASRPVFGEFKSNDCSRFLTEIPVSYLDIYKQQSSGSASIPPYYVHSTSEKAKVEIRAATKRIGAIKTQAEQMELLKPKMPSKTKANVEANMTKRWKPGDRVKHDKWGEGIVLEVNGIGTERELKIKFLEKGRGIKTLSLIYAPIKKIKD